MIYILLSLGIFLATALIVGTVKYYRIKQKQFRKTVQDFSDLIDH